MSVEAGNVQARIEEDENTRPKSFTSRSHLRPDVRLGPVRWPPLSSEMVSQDVSLIVSTHINRSSRRSG